MQSLSLSLDVRSRSRTILLESLSCFGNTVLSLRFRQHSKLLIYYNIVCSWDSPRDDTPVGSGQGCVDIRPKMFSVPTNGSMALLIVDLAWRNLSRVKSMKSLLALLISLVHFNHSAPDFSNALAGCILKIPIWDHRNCVCSHILPQRKKNLNRLQFIPFTHPGA